MKKTLAKIILGALIVCGIVSMGVSADGEVKQPEKKQLSILCIGNSILNHGQSESLGWYGNWGMAASSKDKDYYHLLQKRVAEDFPEYDVSWSAAGVATLERSIDTSTTRDYTQDIRANFGNAYDSAKPDIVIFQIGENVQAPNINSQSYGYALIQFAKYCTDINPDVKIIFCKPFWAGSDKVKGVEIASAETGFPIADLSVLNTDENKAFGLFDNSGVASHPGDKGMENISKIIYSQLAPTIRKIENEGLVSVRIDGSYVNFDVQPQIIEERTMVPLRAIFEALGAAVEWDDATKTVTSVREGVKVSLTIGSKILTVDGKEIELDVPAQIVDERTLVPVRAISEAYDCTVGWDGDTKTVNIELPVIIPVACEEIKLETCDNNKSGYTPGSTKLTVEADPDNKDNSVFVLTCTNGSKCWSYIWHDFKFEAGKSYTIEADVRAIADYNGDKADSYYCGFCFHFGGRDNAVKGANVKDDEWTHITTTYTVPDDYEYREGGDMFGAYMNPVGEYGVSFMIDNISVVKND